MEKTIACISTPLGRGAISIIRMSGPESLEIAEKLFYSSRLQYKNIISRFMYLGDFYIDENIKEKCLMVYFKNPNSYTGEDMVEFQVHGGTLLTQKILEKLIENGATLAQPGEFSRRAFENGKISLDEAESIIGEINAESEGELNAALTVAGGSLKQEVVKIQDVLTDNLAEIEATLDYPEEDFESEVKDKIFKSLEKINTKVMDIVKQSQNSKYINYGINIGIVGSPNVGKSSLLNAILGRERAIVTDIEGTTRDSITESVDYHGIRMNFVDTAGIRDAVDKVEQLGVERSKEYIKSSDIVLYVIDGSRELTEQDKEILNLIQNQNHIVVVNKTDKGRVVPSFENEVEISALNKMGIDNLLNQIYHKVIAEEIDFNKLVVTNERQVAILKESLEIINQILERKEESMDIISMLIKSLWQNLGKITGQCENEKIIDVIFSKFCLGK